LFENKTHIFFDLDHTLWDYDRNCEEALNEIYDDFQLQNIGIANEKLFLEAFHKVNNRLWDCYDKREITSEELRHRRFREVFDEFGIADKSICDYLHDAYMIISPNKPHLLPGAKAILDYLKPKYSIHIITNGIADIQSMKMKASGIENYFESVTCSQKANARKPEKEIFEYAINMANTTINQSVMIGDNILVDIAGAINANMDFVHYGPQLNFSEQCGKFTVKHLLELKQFL
jgi:YjjG family noncanonical pyrimidine nucleotidase